MPNLRVATRRFGIQRLFVGLSRFHLTFDWRAYSSNSPTTRASIELVDAADETVIHRQVLIAGSTLDSGWLTFPPTDFSDLMPSSGTDVIVRIFLSDAWAQASLRKMRTITSVPDEGIKSLKSVGGKVSQPESRVLPAMRTWR